MLVVHSMCGTMVSLVTNRSKERDILLNARHCRHLHPLRGLVTHILHLHSGLMLSACRVPGLTSTMMVVWAELAWPELARSLASTTT